MSITKKNSQQAETIIDARELKCPEPVMLLRNALRGVATNTQVTLLATDPSTSRDIPTMCKFMGHKILLSERIGDEYRFVVVARAFN